MKFKDLVFERGDGELWSPVWVRSQFLNHPDAPKKYKVAITYPTHDFVGVYDIDLAADDDRFARTLRYGIEKLEIAAWLADATPLPPQEEPLS